MQDQKCQATYRSDYYGETFHCEVVGEHVTGTDEYGVFEVHSATRIEYGKVIGHGKFFGHDIREKVKHSYEWDDEEPGAVTGSDGSPAHKVVA